MRNVGDQIEHNLSGNHDRIDASNVHPDGSQVVRLEVLDRWFLAADTTLVTENASRGTSHPNRSAAG